MIHQNIFVLYVIFIAIFSWHQVQGKPQLAFSSNQWIFPSTSHTVTLKRLVMDNLFAPLPYHVNTNSILFIL